MTHNGKAPLERDLLWTFVALTTICISSGCKKDPPPPVATRTDKPVVNASVSATTAMPEKANQASTRFLAGLDELMTDFVSAGTSDDEMAKQYRIDLSWAVRMGPPVAQFGCFYASDGSSKPAYSKAECEKRMPSNFSGFQGVWRKTSPAKSTIYLYSGTKDPPSRGPELMTRLAAKGLKIPDRFFCSASALVKGKAGFTIVCQGLPHSMLRVSGVADSASNLALGDIVSVPLADTKRDPDGVLLRTPVRQLGQTTWMWAVNADASSLTVVEHDPKGTPLGNAAASVTGQARGNGGLPPADTTITGSTSIALCTPNEQHAAEQNGFTCAGWKCLEACVARKGFPGSCVAHTDRFADCQSASNECSGTCRGK